MELTRRLRWKHLFLAGLAVLVVLFYHKLFAAALPFLLGYLLAAAIEPFVSLLTRYTRLPRPIGVALTLTLLIGLALYALTLAVGRLVGELAGAARSIPELGQLLAAALERVVHELQVSSVQLPTPSSRRCATAFSSSTRACNGF